MRCSALLLPLSISAFLLALAYTPAAHATSCSANPYQKYYDIPFPDSCNEDIDEQPMRFRIRDPLMAGVTEIVAVGEVKPDTATQFTKFLDANASRLEHVVTVTLNSPGGHLDAGLAMGLIIRQRGFLTSIMPNEAPAGAAPTQACASSCNFIFMGGVRRTLPPGALFITHRFKLDFTKVPDPPPR
jgi:ATP-dependent protease ClpP protease subunit